MLYISMTILTNDRIGWHHDEFAYDMKAMWIKKPQSFNSGRQMKDALLCWFKLNRWNHDEDCQISIYFWLCSIHRGTPPSFDPQDCDSLCKMDWLYKFLLSGAHLIFKFSSCFMMLIQRQRTQVNGKILEDGNNVHVDTQINGT